MYWRSGAGSLLLWIASLTLAMSAFAAATRAGSTGAAWCFLIVAALLAPPVQEAIARWRNPLAPRKAAVTAALALLPLGLGLVVIDGAAHLDRQARRLGFASGGEWARARDLGIATPDALKAHEAAVRKKAREAICRTRGGRLLLDCYEPAHQKAALAWADTLLGVHLEAELRDALNQLSRAYVAVDKGCSDLAGRIEEDAQPVLLRERSAALEIAAAAWAAHFPADEMERLAAKAKPGVGPAGSADARSLDQRVAALAPVIEKEIDAAWQAWARRIVLSEPSWQSFMKGRGPLAECKPVKDLGREAGLAIDAQTMAKPN